MKLLCVAAAGLLACHIPAAKAQTFGSPVVGMCLLSRDTAISGSQAGQSMQRQVAEMQQALTVQLATANAAIEQQRRDLAARQASTPPVEFQRQLVLLDQQAQELNRQQNERFIAAQQRGQQQMDQALNEALSRVITRQRCAIVAERDNFYGWNDAMDITAFVTAEINAVLKAVELE